MSLPPGGPFLGDQIEFATCDPERAHDFLLAYYPDSRISVRGSPDGFRFHVAQRNAGQFTVATLCHNMRVQADLQPLGQIFVGRVLAGRFEREVGREVVRATPGDVFLMSRPDEPFVARWDVIELQVYRIDVAALHRLAASSEDAPPLRWAGLEPVSPAAAAYWARTADYVAYDLLARPEAAASPLLVGNATILLGAALLSTFPVEGRTANRRFDRTDVGPRALRRAIEFIEASADGDVAVADIAAAARVSVRAVQRAFRIHLETTPNAYLRDIRLHRAHGDLVNGDPTRGDTVGLIAARWGFRHPGRFSVAYRRAYGRSPRTTLHG
ncbi:helix-turn-helix transcriptional regulator [Micromonospora sp. NPDC050397]|uniref:helix-turn-helix transcriptional regulator n=1 Tax=Micromonospora sp. NPDC050397 TaxID=3364279 RepID=UPI00384BC997